MEHPPNFDFTRQDSGICHGNWLVYQSVIKLEMLGIIILEIDDIYRWLLTGFKPVFCRVTHKKTKQAKRDS